MLGWMSLSVEDILESFLFKDLPTFTFLPFCLTNDVRTSKVSEAVSVVCVGQEVEPPSTMSLELVKENSSTLVLGLSSHGHLSLDISEYLVPGMHGAELRCIASNGEGSSKQQTKHAEIKLDIIRKLETLVLGSQIFGLLCQMF